MTEKYPLSDWQYEVANGDTNLGYKDWVAHQMEANDEVPATECDKMLMVKDKSHIIGQFMDWLREEKKWTVCEVHEHDDDCFDRVKLHEEDEEGVMQRICGCRNNEFVMVPLQMEQLLAEFFEIDLNKVEGEKRALLDQQRAINDYHAHLDKCPHCERHPFDQCPEGLRLLHAFGGTLLPKPCPHGEPLGECNACDVAGDLAFDADREDRH